MTTQKGTAHGKDKVQLNELVVYEYNLNDKPRKAPANIGCYSTKLMCSTVLIGS